MGDSLGLIGKRLLLLLNDGSSASAAGVGTDPAAWLRGTVRAVSLIGLASPGVEVRPTQQQQHTVKTSNKTWPCESTLVHSAV